MGHNFFSGSYRVRLDEKNRFVLPQQFRYQLVEDGQLEFVIAPGGNGFLAIYKKSEIDEMVELFRKKKHVARFQSFFTLFFSSMIHATCDKLGRVTLPASLLSSVGIEREMTVAGAMDKIQIWPAAVYDAQCSLEGQDVGAIIEEIMHDSAVQKEMESVLHEVDN